MIEIDFQEEYNKPIVLYNGCICRTRVSNDKITIFEDFDTCNLQEIDKIKIVEIMNKIIDNSKRNMNFESTLYSIAPNYKVYRFPPIRLEKPIQRSGDNKIMYDL